MQKGDFLKKSRKRKTNLHLMVSNEPACRRESPIPSRKSGEGRNAKQKLYPWRDSFETKMKDDGAMREKKKNSAHGENKAAREPRVLCGKEMHALHHNIDPVDGGLGSAAMAETRESFRLRITTIWATGTQCT